MSKPTSGLDRRAFIAFFYATGLGGTLFPGALWARLQQENGESGAAITAEMIADAERVAGIELSEDEREMMLRGVERNLRSYEELRALRIPNEVPPALVFDPRMPGVLTPDAPASSGDSRASGSDAHAAASLRLSEQSRGPRSASDEDLAFLPVARLAELVRTRQVGSEELTKLSLDRLRRYDSKLLAIVNFTEDRALRSARAADREIAAGGYRGPLHGLPWGAKDLLAVRGYPTTWGAAPYRDQVVDEDATAVRRLDDAGAVLVAKLTLGALAMGDVWFGGRTRNPWDTTQGASGSSAGPGAATAAGCVAFALGTETRGSIVSPSTRNGNTGLRPTFGRVARTGAMALAWSMDKIGPMCRSAEDCALVFAAIHGADGRDPAARTVPFRWDPYRPLRELRIGYLARAFEEPAPPAEGGSGGSGGDRYPNRAFDLETLRVLREDLSLTLHPVEMPDFPIDAVGFMLTAEAAAAFDELTRSNRDDALTRQDPGAWPNLLRTARTIPAVEYIQASRARTQYMRLLSAAWRDVDVVVAPSFRGGHLGATNLTGHPCVVLPNGFDQEGRPASITFLAHLDRDEDALLAAHAYQQATDFHRRRPDLEAQPDAVENRPDAG
ncbi:MAG TPA: amidase [Thermoanaerobaculia bacterium]|nr:amidase [Thermoanaerobaculia bacterium]